MDEQPIYPSYAMHGRSLVPHSLARPPSTSFLSRQKGIRVCICTGAGAGADLIAVNPSLQPVFKEAYKVAESPSSPRGLSFPLFTNLDTRRQEGLGEAC